MYVCMYVYMQHLVKIQANGRPISTTMLLKPTKEVQLHVGINIQTIIIKHGHDTLYMYIFLPKYGIQGSLTELK